MKKAVIKDALREIKKSYKRFISILLMAFLGVGFFAGIRASSPDMLDTIDTYYKNQNVYDIQVLSTLGLTSDDINAISKIENVEHVDGNFETDGQIEVGNKEVIAKVMSLNDFNTPVLIDGSLPSAKNECVVEERFLTVNNKNIGDTIELNIKDMQNDNGEDVPYLYEKELKIVGTVQSPMYISVDRGTSTLGSGKIDYYMYIPKSNVQANSIYTNIYVKVKDANKYTTSSKKYEDCVNSVKTEIEKIKDNREKSRYDSLVNTVTKKVEDAEKELNTQKTDAKSKIADAKKELENVKYDLVICSPMKRAKQTAEIINEGRDIPIITDERIRERKLGDYEGRDVTEEMENNIWDYKLNYNIPNGENLHDFEKREISMNFLMI